MRKLTVAAVQMSCSVNPEESIKKADALVMEAVNTSVRKEDTITMNLQNLSWKTRR